jgi:hypothetical protein
MPRINMTMLLCKNRKESIHLEEFRIRADRPPSLEERNQMMEQVVSASYDPPVSYLAQDVRPLLEKQMKIIQNQSSTTEETNAANLEISKIEFTRVKRFGFGTYDDFLQQMRDVRRKLEDRNELP